MKKILALVVMLSLFGYSCSTKFKVGAEYKEVTVVYGLLAVADTAHYIKITKGYFSETLNNLEQAKNPDSIYFNDLSVSMEVINNGNVVQTIPLSKVDLNLEGYPKQSGVFANSPNYAYKFKSNLDANKNYRLKIKNNASGKLVQGETSLITSSPASFKFLKPIDNQEDLIFSDPTTPFLFMWRGPSTAAFYDVVIRFKYQEVDLTTSDTIYVEKDIAMIKNILTTTSDISAKLSSVDFFKQLNSAVGEPPSNIRRYVDTPGLMIAAGGRDLKTYIDVNTAQGGITYDQIKPNYTNLQGENVFGIFSTRGSIQFDKIKFNGATVDSILNGSNTKNLRFVGISTQ